MVEGSGRDETDQEAAELGEASDLGAPLQLKPSSLYKSFGERGRIKSTLETTYARDVIPDEEIPTRRAWNNPEVLNKQAVKRLGPGNNIYIPVTYSGGTPVGDKTRTGLPITSQRTS